MSPLKLKRRYVEKNFFKGKVLPFLLYHRLVSCSNFFEGLLYIGIFSLQGVIDLRQQSRYHYYPRILCVSLYD